MDKQQIIQSIDRSGGPDACWPWTRARLPEPNTPYGVVKFEGKLKRVHRLIYEWFVGPIPEGLLVRHSCDNPPCCNPAHLLVGSVQDNSDDMVSRGRAPSWPTDPEARAERGQGITDGLLRAYADDPTKGTRGEERSTAKLTEDQVRSMRAERERGDTLMVLAQRYGISNSLVSQICKRQKWRHVDG